MTCDSATAAVADDCTPFHRGRHSCLTPEVVLALEASPQIATRWAWLPLRRSSQVASAGALEGVRGRVDFRVTAVATTDSVGDAGRKWAASRGRLGGMLRVRGGPRGLLRLLLSEDPERQFFHVSNCFRLYHIWFSSVDLILFHMLLIPFGIAQIAACTKPGRSRWCISTAFFPEFTCRATPPSVSDRRPPTYVSPSCSERS